MDAEQIAKTLHPLERRVLISLKKTKDFDEIVTDSKLKEVEVMRALQWMRNKKLIGIQEKKAGVVKLGENGKRYLKQGLPERILLKRIKDEEVSIKQLSGVGLSEEELNVAIGVLKKKAAIDFEKGNLRLNANGKKLLDKEMIEEGFLKTLSQNRYLDDLKDEERFALENLNKRKGIIEVTQDKTIKVILTQLGEQVRKGIKDEDHLGSLTSEIIKKQEWKEKKLRAYDISADVPKIYGGKRHFVNQAVDYIKRIWLDLGFKEMKGTLVQTSFWDLDALFVPQDHPARDMQDTFYIKDPRYGKLPKEFVDKVKRTHEDGWTTGSKGWQYKWSEDIAKENLLRTHTTVLSARTIASLKKQDLPAKFFSVKRVFRNETLSWKSLFEFVQVEGIVVDPNANFEHLKGYLEEFFHKLGYKGVRIRPGHFPYTEPSAEVDVFHPEKKQWVELGGSGIFRPEVTKPLMGFECPVLAWGLGMERSIMEYYKISDIRELYNNDIKRLREIKAWMM